MKNLNINTITLARKYKITDETIYVFGRTLHRIESLRDFSDVKVGDKGGWIEKGDNLSHKGDCWVYGNAKVCDDAKAYGNAKVCGNAHVCGDAHVYGNATIYGNANVRGHAIIYGDARVYDKVAIYDSVRICGDAHIHGNVRVCGNAHICGNADMARIAHYICFQNFGSSSRTTTVFKTTNGHMVLCGCFSGTIDEFAEAVEKTHGDSQYGLEYKAIIEVIKLRIESWEG